MNKLLVISYKFPPVYSGYGNQYLSVFRGLNLEKIQCSVDIVTGFNPSKNRLLDTYNIIVQSGVFKHKFFHFYFFVFKLFFFLLFHLKSYDGVHVIKAGPEAVITNLLCRLYGIPMALKVAQDELSQREMDEVTGVKKKIRGLRQSILARTDYLIAISHEIETRLLGIKSRSANVVFIPNGVDTKKFFPVDKEKKAQIRDELSLNQDEILILFAGSISKRKGISEILEAFEMLRVFKKVRVILLGPETADFDIENEIKQLNQLDSIKQIEYRGRVTNVSEYMKVSDIFILPSYSEGLPNVLLEAAACGNCCVVTNIGGSVDIVTHQKTGLVIEKENPVQLKESLEILCEQTELRTEYSNKLSEEVRVRYALTHVRGLYEDLYIKLLHKEGTQ